MTGSVVDTKSFKEVGIEVDMSYKVAISESRIELESEKNRECGKGKLNRTAASRPDVRDSSAKAHKLFEQEMIASLEEVEEWADHGPLAGILGQWCGLLG